MNSVHNNKHNRLNNGVEVIKLMNGDVMKMCLVGLFVLGTLSAFAKTLAMPSHLHVNIIKPISIQVNDNSRFNSSRTYLLNENGFNGYTNMFGLPEKQTGCLFSVSADFSKGIVKIKGDTLLKNQMSLTATNFEDR
jgi:hypothetical protein